MPAVGPRAKYWCFTLNNYTPADEDRLSTPIDGVDYLVYGREVGASGTKHLQGTVCFSDRKRLPQVIDKIGQAHCTITRLLHQSIEYCKKDGDFVEVGDVTVVKEKRGKPGVKCEIEEFKNSVKEGVTDMKQLREMHSEVCARHPRFVESYVQDHISNFKVKAHPLRRWQGELYDELKHRPDERKIYFVVDRVGNQGKSWFARYYCDLHDDAQILAPGKKADMAYMVKENIRVFFVDCPRSKQGDFIQYDFLEELKNGYVFSSKYESRCKKFPTPHIVVCMNEHPCMEKLSADRYRIITLSGP
jgi:hypothetical protein